MPSDGVVGVPVDVASGLLQGSVLGPLIVVYIVHLRALPHCFEQHGGLHG